MIENTIQSILCVKSDEALDTVLVGQLADCRRFVKQKTSVFNIWTCPTCPLPQMNYRLKKEQ